MPSRVVSIFIIVLLAVQGVSATRDPESDQRIDTLEAKLQRVQSRTGELTASITQGREDLAKAERALAEAAVVHNKSEGAASQGQEKELLQSIELLRGAITTLEKPDHPAMLLQASEEKAHAKAAEHGSDKISKWCSDAEFLNLVGVEQCVVVKRKTYMKCKDDDPIVGLWTEFIEGEYTMESDAYVKRNGDIGVKEFKTYKKGPKGQSKRNVLYSQSGVKISTPSGLTGSGWVKCSDCEGFACICKATAFKRKFFKKDKNGLYVYFASASVFEGKAKKKWKEIDSTKFETHSGPHATHGDASGTWSTGVPDKK